MPNIAELTRPLRHERDLSVISGKLRDVVDARFDVVAPQRALTVSKHSFERFALDLGSPQITPTGVTEGSIDAQFTRTAYRQVADRLNIPLTYLDRLRAMENPVGPRLGATTINDLAWADGRQAMYRFLHTEDGWLLRAVLSDRYQVFDGDSFLGAVLQGLSAEDLSLSDCMVDADVTMDRMRLRITIPAIELAVPDLLGDYRMPFTMDASRDMHGEALPGETPPVLWAGMEFSNSETGGGAISGGPRAVVGVCRNGLTREVALRRTHLGARLEEGRINWSTETRRASLDLIASQVTDVVRTYCSTDYLVGLADEMRAAKGIAISAPANSVTVVQDVLGLTDAERESVFDCFARGGDMTVFGLAQAVTAAAQTVDSSDRQSEMEMAHWQIVESPRQFA